MKPFWKTSEFWATVLTSVGTVGAALAGVVAAPVAAVITVASTAAYTIGRSITKAGK